LLCPSDGATLIDACDARDLGRSGPDGVDPMVGITLDERYTILAKLGAGSMGAVYRARQHAMGREVAIKILRGDRANDDSAKARFMREARANSLLASPNTVTVFDFGQSETGEFYLAMELLEGESLGQRLARVGRLSAPIAVDACRQALRSLGEAHAKGIIHRDLKPDNLFFGRVLTSATTAVLGGNDTQAHDEIVKVLDFGIAKMIDTEGPNAMNVVETQAGTVFGTPRYMSPEQAQGKPLDARSDLYSLAVILYQMLTGRPPFADSDAVVVMARHIKSTPKRPNEVVPEAMVPAALEDVLMRTLAKDPKDRPASAEVLAGELLAAIEGNGANTSGVRTSATNAAGIRVPASMRPPRVQLPDISRRWPRWAVATAIVVAAAVFALTIVLSRPPRRSIVAVPLVRAPSAIPTQDPSKQATITPESLPQVANTTQPAAGVAGPGRQAAKGTTALPANVANAGTATAGSAANAAKATPGKPAPAPRTVPAAAPAGSSQYGIFE
jgi:serine/threonine-protein kinase